MGKRCTFLVIVLLVCVGGFHISAPRNLRVAREAEGRPTTLSPRCLAVQGFKNDNEREEQYKVQQEMLAKRRNPRALEKEKAAIEARRVEASKKINKTLWAKNSDPSADPIDEWRDALKKGDIKDLGYSPEPPKSKSLFGITIPLPLSPIDVPEYDNGMRFDLRLPYAERGYEDADADVMGKLSSWFKSLGKANKEKS